MTYTNTSMPIVHTIKITYSDGSEGTYIGRCPFEPGKESEITIQGIAISDAEDVSEELLTKIRSEVTNE